MGMRRGMGVAAAALFAATLGTAMVARADWDDRVDPSDYEEQLAPNGAWVVDDQLGRVWRPSVWWDWHPYVDGHWIWTSYGWTWVSFEPWAWTFHYGRWGFSNLYGWVWSPGTVWGPAWVNWYWGDGFVGWVPLGPPGFVVAPGYWVYVHDSHFCAPHVTTVIVPERSVPHYVIEHHQQGWGREHAPGLHDIELVSRHPVVQQSDRPRESIAPWVHDRVERGVGVHEHVMEQGRERVIDHAPRVTGRPEHPAVVDDGGWRHGEHGAPRAARPAAPHAGTVDVPPVTGPSDQTGRPYVIEHRNGRWEASGGGAGRPREQPRDSPGAAHQPPVASAPNLPPPFMAPGHQPSPGRQPIAPAPHGAGTPPHPVMQHPAGRTPTVGHPAGGTADMTIQPHAMP
jgi:uncharacterized protein DUF6600